MNVDALSRLEADAGRWEDAARLAGAAIGIKERVGGGAPARLLLIGDVLGDARAAIAEAADRAWAEGRAMALDQVVRYLAERAGPDPGTPAPATSRPVR